MVGPNWFWNVTNNITPIYKVLRYNIIRSIIVPWAEAAVLQSVVPYILYFRPQYKYGPRCMVWQLFQCTLFVFYPVVHGSAWQSRLFYWLTPVLACFFLSRVGFIGFSTPYDYARQRSSTTCCRDHFRFILLCFLTRKYFWTVSASFRRSPHILEKFATAQGSNPELAQSKVNGVPLVLY